jgi:two-component system chemotaxis response regulator CheV
MVISDIEMPKLDGYSLVTAIREDSRLADLYVILHSSLSGVFNESMVQKVGADHFLAKFVPDELAQLITERLNQLA